MRIITISRQFGSGGRELGKRLADILGWDYYDKEIIGQLADRHGLDEDYISGVLSSHAWRDAHITYRNSFNTVTPGSNMKVELLLSQKKIIEDIAKAGNDCVIVGRDADIILRDYNPFRIFVCAPMESRLERCMKHESKKDGPRLTEKEILRNIRKIDKNRAQVREILTGVRWGDSSCFDLTINAGGRDIKKLAEAVSAYALRWFEDD